MRDNFKIKKRLIMLFLVLLSFTSLRMKTIEKEA